MKNKLNYILLAAVLAFSKISYSQQPYLVVYYLYSEKSRDSHSSVENFSLKGDILAYSVKYTGRRGPDQKDESRICRLSNEQVGTINNIISKYKLNVSDSVVDNGATPQSYSTMTSIVITITNGSKTTKVKVKGDPGSLEDKPLYSNAGYLLGMIRAMLEACHS